MQYLRATHRIVTLLVVVFTLYLSVTGTLVQLVDFKSIFTHAPATDPNVLAMHEAANGPGSYEVESAADYTAASLPAGSDFQAMLARAMPAARTAAAGIPLRYVELRMVNGQPVAQMDAKGKLVRVDATTGALLYMGPLPKRESDHPDSTRNTFKELHRMTTFGNYALYINVVVGTGLAVLIVTGVWMYFKMWIPRAGAGKDSFFWISGGWWRTLHRGVSIVMALWLTVVMLSGLWLAVESLWFGFYQTRQAAAQAAMPRGALRGPQDNTAPMQDGELAAMLETTLTAAHEAKADNEIKVIRLRYFAGYQQGVVVSGLDPDTQQLVFNAATGKKMSETEPGYPQTGFPFGWQAHQTAKQIHRGSYFGLTGRMMDLLSGIAMAYLSISGIVLYWNMWQKRHAAGKSKPVWV